MNSLLSKKDTVSATQKRDEDTTRFSVSLNEKSALMIATYNKTRDKVTKAINELEREHDIFKASILQEKITLTNEVELIRLERTELLKPVDALVAEWKSKTALLDTKLLEVERAKEEVEDIRENLITLTSSYGDKFSQLDLKRIKTKNLIIRLQNQEADVHIKHLEVTKRIEDVTARETAVALREENMTAREANYEKMVKAHTLAYNKGMQEIEIEKIRLNDKKQRINHELRPKS